MNLYRMTYIREGKPRGTTFAAASARKATALAEKWCEAIHCVLLTVKALPKRPA